MIIEGQRLPNGPHRGAKIGPRVLEVRPPRRAVKGWIWSITVYHQIEGKFPGVFDTRLHMYAAGYTAGTKRKAWKQFRAALEEEAARG